MTVTDVRIIRQKLEDHIASDDVRVSSLHESLRALKNNVELIKSNHLQHLQSDVAGLKTDMGWVKKIQWAMVTGIASNLIGIIYIILQK